VRHGIDCMITFSCWREYGYGKGGKEMALWCSAAIAMVCIVLSLSRCEMAVRSEIRMFCHKGLRWIGVQRMN